MEENFEDTIAPQILSEFKYSKSSTNNNNNNGIGSSSNGTGSPAVKQLLNNEKSFSIHNINNNGAGNICSKSLLKNLYNFGGIKSANSSFDSVSYVPTSPIHSSSFLVKTGSFEVPFGINEYVQITPNNSSNSNYNNYPPLPTIYSTGKSLIPSPPVSLCNSTDSLLGSTADLSSMALSSSPSQSVPSSPPAFSKSYKYNNITNNNNNNSILKQSILNYNNNNNNSSACFSPSSSPSSAFSPVQKLNSTNINNNNNSTVNIQCTLNDCLLCQRGQPDILIKSPTWASIMRVVFYTLHQEKIDKPFFSLKSDVYDFMTSHWDILCMNKKKSDNWHKQIQDMLSHSKNIFESGMDKYKQNGFWRLKQMTTDPWILPQKGGRKQLTTSATGSPSSLSSSPSYMAVPSIQTSPLILSNTPIQHSAYPSISSPIKSAQINKLCYEELQSASSTRKRSSIDMLISSSYNDYDMEPLSSPRKKRLSDSGEIKNYSDLDDEDDDEIINNNNNNNNNNNDSDSDDDVLFIDDSN